MAATLIGREEALVQLQRLVAKAAVVAVTGPPGIGKTALARRLDAIWVDLEDVDHPLEVRSRLVRALGGLGENDDALSVALEGTSLIVLDGVEALGHGLSALLDVSPTSTHFVLTSRTRPPEADAVLELGPLEEPAAVALLEAHVRSARRRDELDPAALLDLARALDGVPLALELAAARLRIQAPQALRSPRLEAPSRPARQQLGHAIQSVIDRVSEPAQQVLSVAVALQPEWTLQILEAAAGREVSDALLELLDAGLVHACSGVTFRCLSPIRSVVPADQEALNRLAPWVVGEAERCWAEGTAAAMAALHALVPLLGAVLEADTPEQTRVSLVLAHRDQAMGVPRATLQRRPAAGGSLAHRVRLAVLRVHALRRLGRLDEAGALCVRSRTKLDDPPELQLAQAVVSFSSGSARPALAEALSVVEHCDVGAWQFVGAMQFDQGDLADAQASFERATGTERPWRRAKALASLANTLHERQASPSQVLEVLDTIPVDAYPGMRPQVLTIRAFLLGDQGELEQSASCFDAASEAALAVGRRDSALVRWLMARSLDLAQGRLPLEVLTPPAAFGAPRNQAGATLRCWQVLVRCLSGEDVAEHVPLALEGLGRFGERGAADVAANLAVAMHVREPALAEQMLASLPDDLRTTVIARQWVAGEAPKASSIDGWILGGVGRLASGQVTRVALDGSWFEHGERVTIGRRRVLKRVLAALAGHEDGLDVGSLCQLVWPGETLVGTSGTRRVHVAISTLRGLGLREAIETLEDVDGTRWRLRAQRA